MGNVLRGQMFQTKEEKEFYVTWGKNPTRNNFIQIEICLVQTTALMKCSQTQAEEKMKVKNYTKMSLLCT